MQVAEVVVDDGSGHITGVYRGSNPVDPDHLPHQRPTRAACPTPTRSSLDARDVSRSSTAKPDNGMLGPLIVWMLPLIVIVGLFVWIALARQGQMAPS